MCTDFLKRGNDPEHRAEQSDERRDGGGGREKRDVPFQLVGFDVGRAHKGAIDRDERLQNWARRQRRWIAGGSRSRYRTGCEVADSVRVPREKNADDWLSFSDWQKPAPRNLHFDGISRERALCALIRWNDQAKSMIPHDTIEKMTRSTRTKPETGDESDFLMMSMRPPPSAGAAAGAEAPSACMASRNPSVRKQASGQSAPLGQRGVVRLAWVRTAVKYMVALEFPSQDASLPSIEHLAVSMRSRLNSSPVSERPDRRNRSRKSMLVEEGACLAAGHLPIHSEW